MCVAVQDSGLWTRDSTAQGFVHVQSRPLVLARGLGHLVASPTGDGADGVL